MLRIKHLASASLFNTTKFSADSSNTTYYIGNNTATQIAGTPDVLYEDLVFCKGCDLIYTHGHFYGNAEDAGLKQVDLTSYQGETVGEIVQHTGSTTANFTNAYIYKLTALSRTETRDYTYPETLSTDYAEVVKSGVATSYNDLVAMYLPNGTNTKLIKTSNTFQVFDAGHNGYVPVNYEVGDIFVEDNGRYIISSIEDNGTDYIIKDADSSSGFPTIGHTQTPDYNFDIWVNEQGLKIATNIYTSVAFLLDENNKAVATVDLNIDYDYGIETETVTIPPNWTRVDVQPSVDSSIVSRVETLEEEQVPHVSLTQEEYDALSEEEKNNGTIYLIKESTIPDLIDQLPLATTEEKGLMSANDKKMLKRYDVYYHYTSVGTPGFTENFCKKFMEYIRTTFGGGLVIGRLIPDVTGIVIGYDYGDGNYAGYQFFATNGHLHYFGYTNGVFFMKNISNS